MRLPLALLLTAALAAPLRAEQAGGPLGVEKVNPVAVAWQYSNDGGKTFAKAPLEGPPPGIEPRLGKKVYPYAWKGTFRVDDPSKIAGLWVRLTDGKADSRATICPDGDLNAAAGGYWKDLGYCPTLLEAEVLLNGAPAPPAHGTLLMFWVPVLGPLKAGENTIELKGDLYTYWGSPPAKSVDMTLVAAPAQPAAIYNGPILGDFGEDYFTLACRTTLPADLTVEATPLDPAAPAARAVSNKQIWHRVKVAIPRGARRISYTLTASVGEHQTRKGPFTLELPDFARYRFVAFGNVGGNSAGLTRWECNSRLIAKANPAFLVNTGNPMEQGSWEFSWEKFYVAPAAHLLNIRPTLITPSSRDFTGVFNELHYTPAADGRSHNWSKVVGPVRFIGVNPLEEWKPGNANCQWLEAELSKATEKFIIVLDGIPGYASGKTSRGKSPLMAQARQAILPLLGKYKATLMLCSWDPDYERCEPTPDKGVTQIVTGCIGKDCYRFSRAQGDNLFGPKSAGWKGVEQQRHFCVFDVTAEKIQMRVLACIDNPDFELKNLETIDEKTFTPRQ